jgi:hypothetical protein
MSALQVAEFFDKNVRLSKSQKFMAKTRTIDACLTLKTRLYSLDGVEQLISIDEETFGLDSLWNSIWKQQEIIYRCNKKDKILWFMRDVSDQMHAGVISHGDITVNSIKTGGKSLSDPSMCRLLLKDYLLGEFLDTLEVPSYMKVKVRSIFKSHADWRAQYNPIIDDGNVDTTWMFTWPSFGRDLLEFMERLIYQPQSHEILTMRQAIKNNNTPAELLQNSPWLESLVELKAKIRTSGHPAAVPGAGGAPPDGGSDAADQHHAGGGAYDQPGGEAPLEIVDENEQLLVEATNKVIRQNFAFIEEPHSFTALRDLFQATPLAMLMPSSESGNVLILLDLNSYGETDSRPDRRTCPVHADKISSLIRATVAARYGKEDPTELYLGEYWACFSGGKDRKRTFVKPLQTPSMKKGKDPARLFTKVVTLFSKEATSRARKRRRVGHLKLTQQAYLVSNKKTFATAPQKDYPVVGGSIATDTYGPFEVDPLSTIPKMTLDDKKAYYGKRFVLAGGACPDNSSEGNEDDDAPDDDTGDNGNLVPVNHHCLPTFVVTDWVKAHGVKHIIDLAPTPLDLAFQLGRLGCSYVAVCATPVMKQFLRNQAFRQIKAAITDENEPYLYDSRFKGCITHITLILKVKHFKYKMLIIPPLNTPQVLIQMGRGTV